MKLLTVRDVAEILGVSTSLVYELIEARRITFHRVGRGNRGAIRIREEDLNEYLASCRVRRLRSRLSCLAVD